MLPDTSGVAGRCPPPLVAVPATTPVAEPTLPVYRCPKLLEYRFRVGGGTCTGLDPPVGSVPATVALSCSDIVDNVLIFRSRSKLGGRLGEAGCLALMDACRRRVWVWIDEWVLPTDEG